MEDEQSVASFDPDTVMEIFKLVWVRTSKEKEQKQEEGALEAEAGPLLTKKKRATTANANSLKLSCELLRLFVSEAIQRAALIAEAEG
ncbi:hypothetical protein GOP47_0004056 [Adiantum capillus-veneris]|uniref:Centromere protein X n=1 Tax=Adiantum capillus-veneris TaxID=13818 RepID=A0A9D4ZM86_ADICA|nr:hypothetical protein GOP47_0004056 [Adiantum capillus-veneris]